MARVGITDDKYRFGSGPAPVLQPGTLGWSAADLDDPAVRSLWEDGRYEIIEGVLTTLPPLPFRHGNSLSNLQFCLREHFRAVRFRARFAIAVEIEINPRRVLRADGVVVSAGDLPKFESLGSDTRNRRWEDKLLTLPPTLVIESISPGYEAHDRVTKREWYAEFGVPHYWIVDGFARTLECLRLAGDEYSVDAVGQDDEVVSPASFPGLSLPLRAIWDDAPA